MRILAFAVVAILASLSFAMKPAVALDWTVTQTTSNVKFTTDKVAWKNVIAGMVLPNKSWVDTGARGRLMLQRGTDSISLNPGTLAGVFDLGGPLDKTVVEQQSGKVALDVTRKAAPWMTVKTKMLVALVKGTQFAVTITGKKTSVSVSRGVVQVTNSRNGSSTDIVAGQSASVSVTGNGDTAVTGGKSTSAKATAAAKASSAAASGIANSAGHGSAASNAGGGNAGGYAGGNGNGNAGGNGNGNAGGNGKGNSSQ